MVSSGTMPFGTRHNVTGEAPMRPRSGGRPRPSGGSASIGVILFALAAVFWVAARHLEPRSRGPASRLRRRRSGAGAGVGESQDLPHRHGAALRHGRALPRRGRRPGARPEGVAALAVPGRPVEVPLGAQAGGPAGRLRAGRLRHGRLGRDRGAVQLGVPGLRRAHLRQHPLRVPGPARPAARPPPTTTRWAATSAGSPCRRRGPTRRSSSTSARSSRRSTSGSTASTSATARTPRPRPSGA